MVAQHYPAFVEHMAAEGRPLPDYVQQELDAYLKCGRLQRGFLRGRCDACHAERLVLDGVYVDHAERTLEFRCVRAPTSAELADLAQRIAQRIGRFLERRGLLERDAGNAYLAGEADEVREIGLCPRFFSLRIAGRSARRSSR